MMPSNCICRTTRLTLATLVASLLAACEGSPGESELRALSPADGSERWHAHISAERFTPDLAAPDGILRVQGNDNCWAANTTVDFDRDTGVRLGEIPPTPSAGTAGRTDPWNPPSACEAFVAQRVALASGELLDVCGRNSSADPLVVMNVATATERFRLPLNGVADPSVVPGGRLLVTPLGEDGRIEVFSLDTGSRLWAWTPAEQFTYVRGTDSERVYAWAEMSHEMYALGLADGSSVWQKNLGCEWLSLASEHLVCGRSLGGSSCEGDN